MAAERRNSCAVISPTSSALHLARSRKLKRSIGKRRPGISRKHKLGGREGDPAMLSGMLARARECGGL